MPQFILSKRLEKRMVAFEMQLERAGDAVAKESRDFFKRNFNLQGFVNDNGIEKWKPRKSGTGRHRILWKKGKLRNSILKSKLGNGIWKITSNLPYSAIHNEGLAGKAWGKHPFRMPKRQFIGESLPLQKRMRRLIVQRLKVVDKIIG